MINLQEDWQMQSPGWREKQIHDCLCGIKTALETLPVYNVVEEVNLEAQGAAIAATVLYPVTETDFYEIGWNAAVTRAATSSSKLGDFAIKYTNPADSVEKTTSNQNNVTASTGNTTANCISGTYTIYAKAGTDISYIMGYTSVGATSMLYSLDIRVIKKTT
jgi:hypothetical protein